ncbi:universal stress protein UspA-like protein [Desulfitobacterium dichloroeliminans LMG P-21439]|uniref:Universal stress protein UspA-like protein n=1 Tax=Desulfitobacterium dichloroeliminans (strain LMG P-21439 / DCA1) TaxID=871963 RepID=L0F4R4_DESDL|nr:universal stress protein [Desulfitobacterium dichloroeliminans]AGA68172.1 universal stress protein UspA-like protein [Desulfitobacterium dichloroeliminans LMG P-21439]
MTKILVPVDGSANSDKAIRYALTLAEGKADLLIFLNIQPNYNNAPNVKRFATQEQIKDMQEDASKEVLDHALEIAKDSAVPIQTKMRIGDPGREICAEAEESAIDNIVMGYRGLGAVKRAILGSVATHVLHETPCPVTIVP